MTSVAPSIAIRITFASAAASPRVLAIHLVTRHPLVRSLQPRESSVSPRLSRRLSSIPKPLRKLTRRPLRVERTVLPYFHPAHSSSNSNAAQQRRSNQPPYSRLPNIQRVRTPSSSLHPNYVRSRRRHLPYLTLHWHER